LPHKVEHHEVSAAELAAQEAVELPGREAMSLVNPSLTQGLLAYADQVNASKSAGTAPPSPPNALSLVNANAIRGDASQAPNDAVAQNVESPNATSLATRNQTLPVVKGTP
jgi:hypothetical protein